LESLTRRRDSRAYDRRRLIARAGESLVKPELARENVIEGWEQPDKLVTDYQDGSLFHTTPGKRTISGHWLERQGSIRAKLPAKPAPRAAPVKKDEPKGRKM
jgi:hypothetical protein